jgi:hypothetical protein
VVFSRFALARPEKEGYFLVIFVIFGHFWLQSRAPRFENFKAARRTFALSFKLMLGYTSGPDFRSVSDDWRRQAGKSNSVFSQFSSFFVNFRVFWLQCRGSGFGNLKPAPRTFVPRVKLMLGDTLGPAFRCVIVIWGRRA